MRDSIYRIWLDIHNIHSQVQITVKQYDNARRILIHLAENDIPYRFHVLSRVTIGIDRPGGSVIVNECDILADGTIAYDFNGETAKYLGLNECEVKVYGNGDELLTSPRFTILVLENVFNDGDPHGTIHNDTFGRDEDDCHPMSAITGLLDALQAKADITYVDGIRDALQAAIDAKPDSDELDELIERVRQTLEDFDGIINGKADQEDLDALSAQMQTFAAHILDTTIHITAEERSAWNNKCPLVNGKIPIQYLPDTTSWTSVSISAAYGWNTVSIGGHTYSAYHVTLPSFASGAVYEIYAKLRIDIGKIISDALCDAYAGIGFDFEAKSTGITGMVDFFSDVVYDDAMDNNHYPTSYNSGVMFIDGMSEHFDFSFSESNPSFYLKGSGFIIVDSTGFNIIAPYCAWNNVPSGSTDSGFNIKKMSGTLKYRRIS